MGLSAAESYPVVAFSYPFHLPEFEQTTCDGHDPALTIFLCIFATDLINAAAFMECPYFASGFAVGDV